ncbi:hypothetical protein SK128_001283 [Halocaridina rubra]|uniref:Uncharacterized protein n=1 Tax=Halocaridina rubra TaxID=373956 RepID=A0AAN8ZY08_HALRR
MRVFFQQDTSGCGRENSLCAFISEITGQAITVRCCGALECLFTGQSYTCTDPKTLDVDDMSSSDFDF